MAEERCVGQMPCARAPAGMCSVASALFVQSHTRTRSARSLLSYILKSGNWDGGACVRHTMRRSFIAAYRWRVVV